VIGIVVAMFARAVREHGGRTVNSARVTSGYSEFDGQPVWLPDGATIACTRYSQAGTTIWQAHMPPFGGEWVCVFALGLGCLVSAVRTVCG
jgi:hypothetical protein